MDCQSAQILNALHALRSNLIETIWQQFEMFFMLVNCHKPVF
ncbi:hypothetical protein ACVWYG_000179 [Pedobacter sp. UYEF25]